MLGHAPLGRFALGQSQDWYVVSADVGAYTLTGVATAFRLNVPITAGSFSFTGNAAPLVVTLPATAVSFTLTGQAASVALTFVADPAQYVIHGDDYAVAGIGALGEFALGQGEGVYTIRTMFRVAMPVTTAPYTVTGQETFLSHDLLGGGGTIVPHRAGDELRSGTAFTKKRYRKLREEEAARQAAQERAREIALAAERQAKIDARLAAAAARQAERDAAVQTAKARRRQQMVIDALAAQVGARSVSESVRMADEIARNAHLAGLHAQEQDEEEAIAHLLLS